MRRLNLGILAHVDAGKTSLTERLLYAAGVIDAVGRVDDGSTQTDFLALERQRGITIRSAVVSFAIDDVAVNLIDTPGHPDFIAEVERVLSVLDGAVLVVSAVEGVQAQTRVLMRALQRLRVPTLIFVNKIDRRGANPERVLQAIADRLTPAIVAMGSASDLGTRTAAFRPYEVDDAAFTAALADRLTANDDALLAAYVADEASVSHRRLRDALASQTGRALVHPVFSGSAITGAGVEALMAGIAELLPAIAGDADGPLSGTVFKIERGPAGEKVAYARLVSGTLRVRDRVQLGRGAEGKVTAVGAVERGSALRHGAAAAGQIAKLWGLADVRVGDAIGAPRPGAVGHHFAPPTLEAAIVPRHPGDKAALHAALAQLAEQDPLINLRQDDLRQEIFVSLYGEVQKEVIQATLESDYAIGVEFRGTQTICVERPTGVGAAVDLLGKGDNPFVATVGLRVEPAPVGDGISFRLDVEVGAIPMYVYKSVDGFREAVEATVRKTLEQGLYGWQVADCVVTMTHSDYRAPSTDAGDVKWLVPLVLMAALREAGTVVCEPIHRFHLELPAGALGATLSALMRLDALPGTPTIRGESCTLEGDIAAARAHELQQQLSALTHGEGMLESEFGRYEPLRGPPPTRPRTGPNPLDRKAYLLYAQRRV
jgi:ribosomal protection tetracycline resistance protein